jgi:RNA polymerase sigma-70 factor (ECF subfamily)
VNRSIDRLEVLKKARVAYKGPWLPIPMVSESSPDERQTGDPLPYALLSVLEKLNPVERAAFVLRRAFDYPYREISEMCDLPEENIRQLVHRAQEKLQNPRIRYETSIEDRQRLLNVFLEASATNDASTLKQILHQDVILYTDGGGKVSAAVVPVRGPEKIINFLNYIVKEAFNTFEVKAVNVNASAGVLFIERATGRVDTICTLETDGKTIISLYFVRNPDKILV